MKPFDYIINQPKIASRRLNKKLWRSLHNPETSFIKYGLEALFHRRVKNQVKHNPNHPINRRNRWPLGRKLETIKQADQKAKDYIDHSSREEAIQMVVSAIHQSPTLLNELPPKAQNYYHENLMPRQQKQEEAPVINQKQQQIEKEAQKRRNDLLQKMAREQDLHKTIESEKTKEQLKKLYQLPEEEKRILRQIREQQQLNKQQKQKPKY